MSPIFYKNYLPNFHALCIQENTKKLIRSAMHLLQRLVPFNICGQHNPDMTFKLYVTHNLLP